MKPVLPLMAVLLALLGWECAPTPAETRAAALPAPAPVRAAPADPPPVEAWTQVALARPLFAHDRRPPGGPVSARAVLPRLAGTIRSPDSMVAIFSPEGDARPIVVARDGTIAGWTVTEITDGAVTISQAGRSTVLRLGYANLPLTPPPAPPAPPAPNLQVLHDRKINPFLAP